MCIRDRIKMGLRRLPEIEKDNTDRNRTSPFAFTGNKFEFRAVGSSQSIAFPIVLLNAAVAESIAEITTALRAELKKTKKVDDAVLKVVRPIFKETTPVRFEGNNYSEEWVKEAAKRGLLNLRRTPEALAQMMTKQSRKLLTSLNILSDVSSLRDCFVIICASASGVRRRFNSPRFAASFTHSSE